MNDLRKQMVHQIELHLEDWKQHGCRNRGKAAEDILALAEQFSQHRDAEFLAIAPEVEPESVDGPTAEQADEFLGKKHYTRKEGKE